MIDRATPAAVTIIIPHRDDLRGLARTLHGLSGQLGPNAEILVVDNGSVAGLSAVEAVVLAANVPARVLSQAEPGAGPARNLGAAIAQGDLLIFVDCDCRAGPGWIERLVAGLADHDIVGGIVTIAATSNPNAAEIVDVVTGFNSPKLFVRDGLLLTGNLAARKAVFDQVGPFRKDMSEDREWCLRAARMGFRLHLSETAIVAHSALKSEAALFARWHRITRETFAFHRHEGRSDFSWRIYAAQIALSPLVHGGRLMTDPRLTGISAARRLAALGLFIRLRWSRARLALSLLGQLDG